MARTVRYVLAAVATMCAAGSRGEGVASGARPAFGENGVCELARVTDRSTVSSFGCIACHDGTSGPGGSSLGSHPVEIDYARAASDAGHHVPPSHLPPLVPLVNGRVACTSCHDAASHFPKHVVDPKRLCFACHAL